MDEERRSVNFTVVPDDDTTVPRIYSNFCSIQNSDRKSTRLNSSHVRI